MILLIRGGQYINAVMSCTHLKVTSHDKKCFVIAPKYGRAKAAMHACVEHKISAMLKLYSARSVLRIFQ